MDFSRFMGNAREKFSDFQLIRGDSFNRIQRAMEDVVEAVVFAGIFDHHEILRFGDDTENTGIALFITANFAGVFDGDGLAHATEGRARVQIDEGMAERSQFVFGRAQKVQRKTRGCFWTDAGQGSEVINDALKRRGESHVGRMSNFQCRMTNEIRKI